MTHLTRVGSTVVAGILATSALYGALQVESGRENREPPPFSGAMNNPYRIVENWPDLEGITPGAAIGIIPLMLWAYLFEVALPHR